MKKYSSYINGLVPWIFTVAGIGFLTRFGVLGKAGHSPHINYVVFIAAAVFVHSAIFALRMAGVSIAGIEHRDFEKNTLLNCFDCAAIMAAILLLLSGIRPLPEIGDAVKMCAVSMAVSAAALTAERSERSGPMRDHISGSAVGGRLLLGGIYAAVAGTSFLVFSIAFGGVEKLSGAFVSCFRLVGNAGLGILRFAGKLLNAFLAWLAALLPEEEIEPTELPAPEEYGVAGMKVPDPEISVPTWVYVVLAALLITALIVFLARNVRFGGKIVTIRRPVRTVRRSRTSHPVRKWWKGVRGDIVYALNRVRYRKTPAGLLVYCEKHAPKDQKRLAGESGEAYLRRMSSSAEIRTLAEHLEAEFYAGRKYVYHGSEYRRITEQWNRDMKSSRSAS